MNSDKKSSLLYVLKILSRYTDKKHLLTYGDIARKLREEHNSDLERKTIARNIEILMDNGYDIVKNGNNGVYLGTRDFEDGELMFLTDAIYSSKSIPTKYAKDLVEKLTRNNSIYDRRRYTHLEKFDDTSRSDNKQLFYTIEQIEEAISNNKKIEFQYGSYTQDKKLKLRKDGKVYKINPYYMVNNRGKYYLVCNYDKYDDISNYKIENIANIRILDEEIKPLKTLPGQANFSIREYMKEHIYMTMGDSVVAKLKVSNEDKINDIVDWFGCDISIQKQKGEIYVNIRVNEEALVYWALQYGENIEIVSPTSTREKIKAVLKSMLEKYDK
ncbi:MAG: WYL domain-containing protein [Clostridiales bacterium]|nr:WYL domain-containing protein [Clostridiales bacterium]